jgi:two-component SAPR family response regulator
MDPDVIVIDDDAVVLFLHKLLIKRSSLPSNIRTFKKAEEALEFLNTGAYATPVLIFLDINMPQCSGWEFLDQIEKIPNSDKFFVVMVTSSINLSDRKKAEKFSRVIDYHEKPLSKEACEKIKLKLTSLLNS